MLQHNKKCKILKNQCREQNQDSSVDLDHEKKLNESGVFDSQPIYKSKSVFRMNKFFHHTVILSTFISPPLIFSIDLDNQAEDISFYVGSPAKV